jgi:hypothetical protein
MNKTEQVFALRISRNFANDVVERGLSHYGEAFAKIAERYEQGQRKPYIMRFTTDEISYLKSECEWVASKGCDWYAEEKACYRGLLRQIARVAA